jgi:hypothetical protein
LLLNVARFRAAARVLCRLDAGEELLLDGAVGRSWTSRFPACCRICVVGAVTRLWSALHPPRDEGTSRFPLAKCMLLPLTRAPPQVRCVAHLAIHPSLVSFLS